MFDMCPPMLTTFAQVVRDDGDDNLAERMLGFVPDISSKVRDVVLADWNHIVYTHGDAWFNNFLFK